MILALVVQAAGEPVATALQDTPSASSAPAEAPATVRRIDDHAAPLTGAVPQGSYEEGLRGAFSRSQSLQGPLDGAWLLKDAEGAGLYRFQLVDRGFGGASLEGAWSDLRGGGADASGFFTGVVREEGRLTLQFATHGSGLMEATLTPRTEGGFSGDLRASGQGKAESSQPVTLVRP